MADQTAPRLDAPVGLDRGLIEQALHRLGWLFLTPMM